MPKGLLQEKFQRTMEPEKPEDHEWADQSATRHTHPTKEMRITSDRPGAGTQVDFDSPKTNELPPGMFIDNQMPQVNDHKMRRVAAGATDVSNSVDAKMLRDGFQLQRMEGTDDLFTNEHVEEFYGEAKGDDDAGNKYSGYVERNNYLDRT